MYHNNTVNKVYESHVEVSDYVVVSEVEVGRLAVVVVIVELFTKFVPLPRRPTVLAQLKKP